MLSLLALALLAAPEPVSPDDVLAAANAFEEGQRAQLKKDYARAAELFELADRAAPSPGALRSAIRNHRAAGNLARAATLALRAGARYADDASTRGFADGTVAELQSQLGRLGVSCALPCLLTVDQRAVTTSATTATELFSEPGEHQVEVSWAGRRPVGARVLLVAGRREDLRFDPPPLDRPPPRAAGPRDPGSPAPAAGVTAEVSPPEGRGVAILPPLVFWSAVGLTAVAGGVTIWSGLDTLSARDAYRDDPTEVGYRAGLDKQRRTNVLIGVTAGLGVVSALGGVLFTDWGDSRSGLVALPAKGGVVVGLGGRL